MTAPNIIGEPQIRQQGPGVVCECTVESADPPGVKWTKDDKEISNSTEYIMKIEPDGSKFKISCEITVIRFLFGYFKVCTN